jgi:ABC-2 type transport system permease protein
MIRALRRQASIYGAIAAMESKQYLAYNYYVWVEYVLQIVSMIIYIYFWRAIYTGVNTLGGLTLAQTINYILLARILSPLLETRTIFRFGFLVRSGDFALELVRPVDFLARQYVEHLTGVGIFFVQKIPLFILAWLAFGLQLPANPGAWLAFVVSIWLGQSALFFFDWMFACLAFYSTETWGLSMVRTGVAAFFSGALVPLAMMPGWLQQVAAAMPFAQALAVPAAFLGGITPAADAPRVWLVQMLWLLGLAVLSRLVFNVAVRKVTVQGG